MPRIAFVTAREWSGLTEDDQLAVAELERRGASVQAAVWDDPAVLWSSFNTAVLRSCWDYFHSPDVFRAWLAAVERSGSCLVNPAATVRWNLDKLYLAELAAAGIAVVPTEYPQPGARLTDVMTARGWGEAVLKPRVSANGHRTRRFPIHEADEHQGELDELLAGPGALVQEYVPSIARDGEVSFVFIGGRYTHAVLKTTAAQDFRVQQRFGGAVTPFTPSDGLVDQARSVMAAVRHSWSYARVDACIVRNRLVVMELELIEPSLFLEHGGPAAALLAEELIARTTQTARSA